MRKFTIVEAIIAFIIVAVIGSSITLSAKVMNQSNKSTNNQNATVVNSKYILDHLEFYISGDSKSVNLLSEAENITSEVNNQSKNLTYQTKVSEEGSHAIKVVVTAISKDNPTERQEFSRSMIVRGGV